MRAFFQRLRRATEILLSISMRVYIVGDKEKQYLLLFYYELSCDSVRFGLLALKSKIMAEAACLTTKT